MVGSAYLLIIGQMEYFSGWAIALALLQVPHICTHAKLGAGYLCEAAYAGYAGGR